MTDDNKMNKAICDRIEPLFDIWKREAGWTEEEACVMYHKVFDDEKPNEETIKDILADEFDKGYEYYHRTKIHRLFKRAKKKLNKIL